MSISEVLRNDCFLEQCKSPFLVTFRYYLKIKRHLKSLQLFKISLSFISHMLSQANVLIICCLYDMAKATYRIKHSIELMVPEGWSP